MKYASELPGRSTCVADWKPVTPEQFADLTHLYCTVCAEDGTSRDGHDGLHPFAMKLDRMSTAVIYYMPSSGQAPDAISSPVLMTVLRSDGKTMCFKSLKYGLESYGLGSKPVPLDPERYGPDGSGTRQVCIQTPRS